MWDSMQVGLSQELLVHHILPAAQEALPQLLDPGPRLEKIEENASK